MLKVLVISNYNNDNSSRPEAEVFLGLKAAGVDVEVMTSAKSNYVQKFKDAGIKIIEYTPRKKDDKKAIYLIRETLIEGKHDILHLFNTFAITNGIKAAKDLPVKIVAYRGYSTGIYWYDLSAYQHILNPRIDKIICNSIGVEKLIKKQSFFNKQKTITINKGHKIAWYNEIKPEKLNPFGVDEKTLAITCVANNRKMKGMKYLMKAINLLPENTNIKFLLIGNDLENPEMLKILSRGKNRKKVIFLGYRNDALNIVKASDIFILPSITGESITKSVIEAMGCGTMAIITDIPGNKELVIDGESGLVVPSKNPLAIKNAVINLYNDRLKIKKLSKGAYERIKNRFSTDYTVKKTLELYKELIYD